MPDRQLVVFPTTFELATAWLQTDHHRLSLSNMRESIQAEINYKEPGPLGATMVLLTGPRLVTKSKLHGQNPLLCPWMQPIHFTMTGHIGDDETDT